MQAYRFPKLSLLSVHLKPSALSPAAIMKKSFSRQSVYKGESFSISRGVYSSGGASFGKDSFRSGAVAGFVGASVSGQRAGFGGASFGSGAGFGGGFGGSAGSANSSFSFSAGGDDGGILGSGREKEVMQNLNGRMAAYLEKVKALEDANAELEIKIYDWYDKHKSSSSMCGNNYSKYYDTIDDLLSKIRAAAIENSSQRMEIENSRLAAKDFRLKYENELDMREAVDADIHRLRKHLDDFTITRSELERQIESLNEELAYLKKDHQEEMTVASGNVSGEVSVEMDAPPGQDLTKILNGMRAGYEALVEKSRREAQAQFLKASEELKVHLTENVQAVQSSMSEVTDTRRTLHKLEIDLQTERATKISLESTSAETEQRYGAELMHIQQRINGLEEQLFQLRRSMELQSFEYQNLLDIRTQLEMEIATYRHLLENEFDGANKSSFPVSSSRSSTVSSSQEISFSQSSIIEVKSQTLSVDSKKGSQLNQESEYLCEEVDFTHEDQLEDVTNEK
ncbi:hypothetical protein NDU88_002190 [Pleurodeles waltl]|uniref:IF rod domain-containing protein n=1 Tax=Pleurodeles waltl TaxID=8319 RepID=A0AAV7Q609_PLEWA|nr:hypothetical protein NDU88_002190 [Pleurodeles waltl]